MGFVIASIGVKGIAMPLRTPFKTSLQTVTERESLVVEVADGSGTKGYGECVAFSTPWYSEETMASCRFVIESVLIPLLKGQTISRPEEVWELFKPVKGNRMAKAAVETAVWDLFAKRQGLPLWQLLGGSAQAIPAGVVVAAHKAEIAAGVAKAAADGYRRVKIKVSPATDVSVLKKVVAEYPQLLFFADANGAFDEASFGKLQEFDEAGLALIEQPFGEQEWKLHARAKEEMNTPICLDESIKSVEDIQRMADEQAGDIVVLKMGRLGGWSETLRAVELCRIHAIGMWVGGMIEFGISKAHNLALASLPGITLPGDFSDSRHFWEQDIIEPEIRVENGKVELSQRAGIGYRVRLENIDQQ
jgi:O-succinylbenzoate synthase